MKMPAVVIKKIVRIQREFLWGGTRGGRKICWVSWKEICKPRSQGGLGVRDIGKVNLSLLIKWRWRLIQNENALWKDILVAKYGDCVRRKIHWVGCPISNRASAWWKEICNIEVRDNVSWFGQHVRRNIGNGNSTRLWLDCWMGGSPLCEQFPRLFSIATNKEGMVCDMWVEREGMRQWDWGWRRRLFVWDEWQWVLENSGKLMIRYMFLGSIFSPVLILSN
jgi:hypothetical protein